eukprot:gene7361-485_t
MSSATFAALLVATLLIATRGLSEEQFYAINPNVDCNSLQLSQKLCVGGGGNPGPAVECLLWHVVTSGDTCSKVWTAKGLSEQRFRAINPSVDCNSLQLSQKLCVGSRGDPGPPVKCLLWHVVTSGDTCSKVWTAKGLSEVQFRAMNPSVDCNSLQLSQQLCVGGGDDPGAGVECLLWHVVTKGDTCSKVWTAEGLSEEQFRAINPNVDCNSLQLSQQLCVGGGGDPGAGVECLLWHVVTKGDTCSKVWTAEGLSEEQFREINPNVDCNSLQLSQQLCVGGGGDPGAGVECLLWYLVTKGDTCSKVWTAEGLSEEQFRAINPNVDCNSLQLSQQLCVGGGGDPGAGVECLLWYLVTKGDTCSKVWTAEGLSEEQFRAINPNVDCNSLQLSQQLCVGGGGDPGAGVECLLWHVVTKGDTCSKVWTAEGLSEQRFRAINPSVDCNSLQLSQQLCVGGKGDLEPPVECLLWHVVTSGDTCWMVWTAKGLREEQFRAINPNVNCSSLQLSQKLCVADTQISPPAATVLCNQRVNLTDTLSCADVAKQYSTTVEDLKRYNPYMSCEGLLNTGMMVCVAASVFSPEEDFSSPLNPQRTKMMGTAAMLLADVDSGLQDLLLELSEAPSDQLNNQVGQRLAALLSRPDIRPVAQAIEDSVGRAVVLRAVVPYTSLEAFCAEITADPGMSSRPGVACICQSSSATTAREPLLYCAALMFESFSAALRAAQQEQQGENQAGERVLIGNSKAGAGAAVRKSNGTDSITRRLSGGWRSRSRSLFQSGGITDGAAEMVGEFFGMVEQTQSGSWISKLTGGCDGPASVGDGVEKIKTAANAKTTIKSSAVGLVESNTLLDSFLAQEITCSASYCMPLAAVFDLCLEGGLTFPNLMMAPFRLPEDLPGANSLVLCGGDGGCLMTDDQEALVLVRLFIRLKMCILGSLADKSPWPVSDILKSLCLTIAQAEWYMAKGMVDISSGLGGGFFGFGFEAKVSISIKAYDVQVVCRDPIFRCEDFCRMQVGQTFGDLTAQVKWGFFGSSSWSKEIPDNHGLPDCLPESALALESVKARLANVQSDKILISQQPDLSWEPSTVYRWADLMSALEGMQSKGVDGKVFWLGDNADESTHGMVSLAAFLAQSMKETIQYDACDENNWDIPTGYAASGACGQAGQSYQYDACDENNWDIPTGYVASGACGQAGQSYQDYKCPAGQEHYQCDVDPNMEIRAATHAKWYGAPPSFFCAPRSKIPTTPKWAYIGPWCDPKKSFDPDMSFDEYLRYVQTYGEDNCRDYPGQKDGHWVSCGQGGCPNDAAPAFQRAARTDVEGCCWWGRGVIQTTGICNFGKLNYFLGARAQREGREAMFPEVDFCKNPEAICTSTMYPQLKWVAGLYYYMSEVQPWDDGKWNYFQQLRAFVAGGMRADDRSFIDGVSGIVNRGCPSAVSCITGPVHGADERNENFRVVLKAMQLVN